VDRDEVMSVIVFYVEQYPDTVLHKNIVYYKMSDLPIILGLTGTGGIILGGFVYLFSNGVQSRCKIRNVEIAFSVRKLEANQQINKYDMRVGDMSVRQLEDIIAESLLKSTTPAILSQPEYPRAISNHNTIRGLEDFIKDTIIHSNRQSPIMRSRANSFDSHHSHHSHHVHRVNRTQRDNESEHNSEKEKEGV